MGFGFADEGVEEDTKEKIQYSLKDVLKYRPWKEVKIGQRVQSLLTGNEGVIVDKEKLLERIEIEWDNGKCSGASRNDMGKVIILEDVA